MIMSQLFFLSSLSLIIWRLRGTVAFSPRGGRQVTLSPRTGRFRGHCSSINKIQSLLTLLSSSTSMRNQDEVFRSHTVNDGMAWQEISIDQEGSSPHVAAATPSPHVDDISNALYPETTDLGDRIQKGKSVILLHNILDEAECKYFVEHCVKVARESRRSELGESTSTDPNDKPSLVRLPTQAAARRAEFDKITCANPLPEYIDHGLQEILRRVCETIEVQLPSLPTTLFGSNSLTDLTDMSSLEDLSPALHSLKYSAREPAVNVYSAPDGEFLPHKDDEALTVLLPLSSPVVDFEGGGTAFWSAALQNSATQSSPPSIILKPTAGTALLFGGNVTHAGMPVLEGTRVVFVCSFSPRLQNNTVDSAELVEDDHDLGLLLHNAAADWHNKWTLSELRDSCPDM